MGIVAAGGLMGLSSQLLGTSPAFASETTEKLAVGIEPFANPAMVEQTELDSMPKRVLIVVDYQVDFVDGGVFGTIEPALALENFIYDRVKEYQDAGDIVIYTMDTHPQDIYDQTREGQVNPPHCIPGTEGWQVYGRVRELLTPEKALLVMKGTYGSADLPFVLKNIEAQGTRIELIEFAGVSTTCRVLHNAIMVYNFFPTLPLIFDETTTASYTDERTFEQLEELESWGFYVKRRP